MNYYIFEFRVCYPSIMENQMEKSVENEMDMWGIGVSILGKPSELLCVYVYTLNPKPST